MTNKGNKYLMSELKRLALLNRVLLEDIAELRQKSFYKAFRKFLKIRK